MAAETREPPRHDVFLSHNSADKDVVEELALCLRREGIRPFFDKWHIEAGARWQEALEKALDASQTVAAYYKTIEYCFKKMKMNLE